MIREYIELFVGVIAATFVLYVLVAIISKQRDGTSNSPATKYPSVRAVRRRHRIALGKASNLATENRPETAVRLRFCHLLWVWSLFLILFATVILFNLPFIFSPELSVLNLRPLEWLREGDIGRRITAEIGPNILLFIPFGFFTPIAFTRMRSFLRTALLVFAVTFSIEFFQYFIGRSSDVDDVIANLAGGVIGYGVFKMWYSRNR